MSSDNNAIPVKTTDDIGKEEESTTSSYPIRITHNLSKQSIFLLGEFLVKDKNGNDITHLFTPTLRILLTTLVLSSEDNPYGVSGEELNQILWSNKSESAARNNRNVSLSKLRKLLSLTGNIAITSKRNFWRIKFEEDVLCDYNEIIAIYRAMKSHHPDNNQYIDRLTDLLYRGTLLDHTEHESFDKYKGDFTYQTVDLLTELLGREEITGNRVRIKIADTILRHDCLNENGLREKCRLLHEQGDLKAANICYRKFCVDYSNLLGIRYTKTLHDILSV